MTTINVSRFCQEVQAPSSFKKTQPKDTSSLLSKIITIRDSVTNLNKSQSLPQYMNIQIERTLKQEAPPRPAQPALVSKLKMAMVDFKQDPEMARKKWGLPKGILEQQTERTVKREATSRPAQPALTSKLKMAIVDFKQDPKMARKKWGLPKGILEQQTERTVKRETAPRPSQPALASKLKMAMVDFKQDPEIARKKWGLSKGIPEQYTVD